MENQKRKKNTKDWVRQVTRYFREISIVVIGIAITLIANDQFGRRNDRRKMRSYLEDIRQELLINLELVNERGHFYRVTRNVADYLNTDDPHNLDPDTLIKISMLDPVFFSDASIIHHFLILNFEDTAFKTLSSSGLLGIVPKDISSSLMNTYKRLDRMAVTNEEYMALKNSVTYELILDGSLKDFDLDIFKPGLDKLVRFYSITNNIHEQLEGSCTMNIEHSLRLLDAALN